MMEILSAFALNIYAETIGMPTLNPSLAREFLARCRFFDLLVGGLLVDMSGKTRAVYWEDVDNRTIYFTGVNYVPQTMFAGAVYAAFKVGFETEEKGRH